jgi:hypothetical protein
MALRRGPAHGVLPCSQSLALEAPMTTDASRPYDAWDLKALMDMARDWALSWDELVGLLTGPAMNASDFDQEQIAALVQDIEVLRRREVDFTTDYREVWRAITGEEVDELPPPPAIEPAPTNPVELNEQYLAGLEFPVGKADILEHARARQAPLRVLEVLDGLPDCDYSDMSDLLARAGELAWER